MMIDSELKSRLHSSLPSQRAEAAEWLKTNYSPSLIPIILDALEKESVPTIRRALAVGLKLAQSGERDGICAESSKDVDAEKLISILDDLAGLIRHETDPAIGWLRRAAAREIPNFESSETNLYIETLRRRIISLETLAAAHRIPNWTRTTLYDVIRDCKPPDLESDRLIGKGIERQDYIDTDWRLMNLIVANALKNASEAALTLHPSQTEVWLETGVSDTSFWLSITNRFDGDSFDFDHVAHTGSSNKVDHKGLGISAMRMAADRLNYDLTLTATGGTAFFSLTGTRFHE